MKQILRALGAVLLVAAFVGAPAEAESKAAAPKQPAIPLAPAVDHHQHLLSPAGAELVNRPPLPAIELPQDLARLLRDVEAR